MRGWVCEWVVAVDDGGGGGVVASACMIRI